MFLKSFNFLFKINFFVFSDRFDMLMSKLIFLKKYYFNIFSSEKYFKSQSLPHSQKFFTFYTTCVFFLK